MSESRGLGCAATIGVFVVGGILGGILGGAVCFVAGGITGQGQLYHQRYQEELKATEPAIRSDPAFGAVRIFEKSDGGIWMDGDVPTSAGCGSSFA